MLVVLGVFVLGYFAFEWIDMWLEDDPDDLPEETGSSEVVYPYYVEGESLRNLAHDLRVEFPTARQITKSRRLSVGIKGTSGEGGQSETSEFAGPIPLSKLAEAAESYGAYEGHGPALEVTQAPLVSDESVLSAAIEQIKGDFSGTSQTAVLLSRVREVFGAERVEAMANKKREELREIGRRNQLLIMHGQFGRAEAGRGGSGPTVMLTHFNPRPDFVPPDPYKHEAREPQTDLIPIAEGVGLRVVLPDAEALTSAGRERINRGQPFYAGMIAHSPSFDEDTGTLTCSAWAVWGRAMPDWKARARSEPYYRGISPGPPYGC